MLTAIITEKALALKKNFDEQRYKIQITCLGKRKKKTKWVTEMNAFAPMEGIFQYFILNRNG